MRVALTVWNKRVSPVFDVSRKVIVLDIENAKELGRSEHTLDADTPVSKARRLSELGVDALICGALSQPFADSLSAQGIKTVPFIAGDIDEVLSAYLSGDLHDRDLSMPGCCGRRRRFRGRRCR